MDYETIQQFADENCLDVRKLEDWHYRLMGEYGDYVLDVYIKRKGRTKRIVNNKVHQWKTGRWVDCRKVSDLEKLI